MQHVVGSEPSRYDKTDDWGPIQIIKADSAVAVLAGPLRSARLLEHEGINPFSHDGFTSPATLTRWLSPLLTARARKSTRYIKKYMPPTAARSNVPRAAAPKPTCKKFASTQRVPVKPASAAALTIISLFLLCLPSHVHADITTGLIGR